MEPSSYSRRRHIKVKEITIIIAGRTGAGKTSLCNKIAGKKIFKEGEFFTSETSQIQTATITWLFQKDLKITIVDTPGFGDNRPGFDNSTLMMMLLSFLGNLKSGFNVCIFCTQAKPRFDEYNIEELRLLGTILEKNVFNHVWVTVTQMNNLIDTVKQKYYKSYLEFLPGLLEQHGIEGISKSQILFGDFDNFEEKFLIPLHDALADTNPYVAPLSKELDFNDPNSFLRVLDSKPMKKYLEYLYTNYEKQIKELEKQMLLEAKKQKDEQLFLIVYEYETPNKKDGNLKKLEQEVEKLRKLREDAQDKIKKPAKSWFSWDNFKSFFGKGAGGVASVLGTFVAGRLVG